MAKAKAKAKPKAESKTPKKSKTAARKPKALARAGHPETSQLAAAAVADSVAAVQRWAAGCVAESPGKTARELAELYCPTDPRRIGRRLPECVEAGTVLRGTPRTCAVSGKKAATWFPPPVPWVQGTLF